MMDFVVSIYKICTKDLGLVELEDLSHHLQNDGIILCIENTVEETGYIKTSDLQEGYLKAKFPALVMEQI